MDTPAAGTNDWMNIGNTIYADMAGMHVGIGSGTINAGAALDLSSQTNSLLLPTGTTGQRPTATNGMTRYNSTTNLLEFYQNGAWVNYTTVSDARLKTEVQPVKGALAMVDEMKPVYFKWDAKNPRAVGLGDDRRHVGFLAQELETVLPEVVNTGADTYRSVEYGQIVAVAVGAIKELKAENDNLRQQVAALQETAAKGALRPTEDSAALSMPQTGGVVLWVAGGVGALLLFGMAGLGTVVLRLRRDMMAMKDKQAA